MSIHGTSLTSQCQRKPERAQNGGHRKASSQPLKKCPPVDEWHGVAQRNPFFSLAARTHAEAFGTDPATAHPITVIGCAIAILYILSILKGGQVIDVRVCGHL
jgi:hypothetical protein